MKKFKPFLDIKKNQWKKSALSWEPCQPLKEDTEDEFKKVVNYNQASRDYNQAKKKKLGAGSEYHPLHDDPILKPADLTDDHKKALRAYTQTPSEDREEGHGSSKNINGYLRNRAGQKNKKVVEHSVSDVHASTRRLSSVFNENNTNVKSIHTFAGIPDHVGEKMIKAGKGSEHHFPSFTSTTLQPQIAHEFARGYTKTSKESKAPHVLAMRLKPGTGVSTVHHNPFQEDEVLVHHGAKIKYHGTELLHPDTHDVPEPTYLHHVTVHREHKKLEEYGDYS